MAVDGYIAPKLLARESIKQMESAFGKRMGADRIFFSGGEPTVHLPFIEKVVEEARKIKPSCKVNFDTNGFMTEDSLNRILAFTTSITYDIKAFYDDTHRAITGAPVEPVLRNAEIVARKAMHKLWEVRIVVIPEVNEEDIGPLCNFLSGISKDLPVCFLAFRPNFVLEEHPGASQDLMARCVELAAQYGLKNVTWSGVTDIRGRMGLVNTSVDPCYERIGAKIGASYALARGCKTHPRECRSCPSHDGCPLKRYISRRSC